MKVLMIATLALITATTTFAQGRRGGHGQGGYGQGGYSQGQMGQQKIQLHIQQHLRGQNIIKLKKVLKQQYPGINVQSLKVKAVKVVAKSKQGRGQVTLLSGHAASYPETIGGTPRDFQYGGPRSFDKIMIQNPQRGTQGKLQLALQGNIKLKKVVLIVKKSMRAKQIVINTYGQHLRGFNVLKLKKMIKQQNPYIDLKTMKLLKVNLIAKSKGGRGQATLIVGQNASYPATVTGNPRMFHSQAPRSYSQILLQSPSAQSMGKWQIELQGNIKVEKVIVTVKKAGRF